MPKLYNTKKIDKGLKIGLREPEGTEWVADIDIDAIVKVSNVKLESSYASELKSVAKQVIGTCQCLGIKIEGKTPKEITAEINSGKWDEKLTVNS